MLQRRIDIVIVHKFSGHLDIKVMDLQHGADLQVVDGSFVYTTDTMGQMDIFPALYDPATQLDRSAEATKPNATRRGSTVTQGQFPAADGQLKLTVEHRVTILWHYSPGSTYSVNGYNRVEVEGDRGYARIN
jgi:hypothetical protein